MNAGVSCILADTEVKHPVKLSLKLHIIILDTFATFSFVTYTAPILKRMYPFKWVN